MGDGRKKKYKEKTKIKKVSIFRSLEFIIGRRFFNDQILTGDFPSLYCCLYSTIHLSGCEKPSYR